MKKLWNMVPGLAWAASLIVCLVVASVPAVRNLSPRAGPLALLPGGGSESAAAGRVMDQRDPKLLEQVLSAAKPEPAPSAATARRAESGSAAAGGADALLSASRPSELENLTGRYRLPGEFEPLEAVVLAPSLRLEGVEPWSVCATIAALKGHLPVIGLVRNEEEEAELKAALRQRGVPEDSFRPVRIPYESSWIRDYGPLFLLGRDGRRLAADTQYAYPSRGADDRVPARLAELFQTRPVEVPLVVEGGNLLSNGHGLCLSTTALAERNSPKTRYVVTAYHDYDLNQIRSILSRTFGFSEIVFLEPLEREKTEHVDMFAAFTSPNTVVVGRYHPAVDPVNAALLDRNAARLEGLPTAHGPLRVERIPMPTNRDGVFRTYTNVLLADGLLLLPSYPGVDEEAEREAVAVYTRLLPGWRIERIDVSGMIRKGGGLHCLSVHVPKADRAAAHAHGFVELPQTGE